MCGFTVWPQHLFSLNAIICVTMTGGRPWRICVWSVCRHWREPTSSHLFRNAPWLLCSLVTFSRIQQPAMISMTMILTLSPDMTPLMKTSKLMALVFSLLHLSFLCFFNKIGLTLPPVTTWLVEPGQKDGHTVCQFKHYQLQQLKYKLMRCVNQQDQWGRVCMYEKILQVL